MLTETRIVGRDNTDTQDTVTGLRTHNPEANNSSPGGFNETNGNIGFGQSFKLYARLGVDANSPADATTYDALWFNKNAPWRFRVVGFGFVTLDVTAAEYTNADGGNLTIALAHGDGESSETFTAITTFDLDENVPANNLGLSVPASATHTMDQAQCQIEEGDSLRARVTLDPDATAGATNDGGEFLVWVECVRVR